MNHKLTLDIDGLKVDSFATLEGDPATRGTVAANAADPSKVWADPCDTYLECTSGAMDCSYSHCAPTTVCPPTEGLDCDTGGVALTDPSVCG